MTITMARMQKPVYLTIGKFSQLTLRTFLSVRCIVIIQYNFFLLNNKFQVTRVAFSFYTFLRQMERK